MYSIIEQTFRINFNKELKEKLLETKGGTFPTQVDILHDEWVPQIFEKFDHLYSILTVAEYKAALDLLKSEWLNDGIYDYINALRFGMCSPDDLVVAHNDIQECNILSMKRRATDLVIIDYEYTTLGNKEYDLGNIFAELILDNSYPYFPFIEFVPENCLEEHEFRAYSEFYLKLLYKHGYSGELSEAEYVSTHIDEFLTNVYCSMVLSVLYWGFWSVLMINESKVNQKIFNFGYVTKRIEMHNFLMTKEFVNSRVQDRILKFKEAQLAK